MKKATILIIVLLLLAILITSCWKKQQHEITAPETPVYSITGRVADMDSGDILPDIIVSLVPIDLIYDYDFTGAVDTTNSKGEFQFSEMTPGSYQFTCFRNSFPVIDENFVLDHADKQTLIVIPKPIVAREGYGPSVFPSFRGITWKNSGAFAGVGIYKAHSDDAAESVVIVGSYLDGFAKVGSARYTRENPDFYSLAYLGRFWTTDGNESKTKLWSIDPARGNVDGETLVEFGLRDLTSDKQNLWATTSLRKIVKFGEHPSKVEQVFDVQASQPYGIAWSQNGMWITDFESNLLLKLDKNMQVETSYRTFGWNDESGVFPLSNLRYLAFDFSNNLWANDGSNTFKFKIN